MKRYVKASVDSSVAEEHLGDLINEAHNIGYEMTVEDIEGKLSVKVVSNTSMLYMPEISVITERDITEDGDECYVFKPNMSFPDLNYDEIDVYDDYSYFLNTWAQVGQFVSKLAKYQYCPDRYEY